MDSLQYLERMLEYLKWLRSFKPCYKWIAFNTELASSESVLNSIMF